MKKETAILGFIVIGAAAFLIGQQMNKSDGDGAETPAVQKSVTATTDGAQDKAQVAATGDSDIVPVGASYTKGPATAPVTIIEFSEFQCPFCKRVNPTIAQIQKEYGDKVRIVFKHNPLSFHKDAPYAAKSALAAGKQGKFWEMHDKLFQDTKKLKPADVEKYVSELGLDAEQFKKDVASPEIAKMVEDDQKLAAKVGARGTPNFFINGEQLSGAQPFDRFKTVIDKQLKQAEAAIKAGTKPDAVYAAMVKKNFKEPAKRPSKGGKKADDSKTVYKIPVGDSYGMGGKEPLVTIIEFSEFQCPFCKRVLPTMETLKKDYGDKIRIVFKHNPLPFHKDAPAAAKAALAAGEQGKFWEMHDKLFQDTKKLKPENLEAYATELGLDMAKWKTDMESDKVKKMIADDQKLASQFGARGTPNFFINGRKLTGARPVASFKQIIDEEIKKAEALIAKGTPRANVYAELTKNGATKAAAPAPRKPKADDKTVYKVAVDADDATKGPADALVTIIEFSEFQCPFCKRVTPTLNQITDKYGDKVRIVFKHNPLPFHKDAPYAAYASIAAQNQGKFWEMHDKLFQNPKDLKPATVERYATEIGLDMSKFKADVESETAKASVKKDQALANSIGARGTPNFFINGRKLVGAQPFANFQKVIDEEIKKAEALVAKGTPKAKVYAELTKNGATKAAAPARKAPEDDKKVYTVKVNPNDAFKGPQDAKITIVEFSEFQCPFCKRVNPTIDNIMKKYAGKVKVVFKHNPLSFHKDAPLASQASLAAKNQGKFWEMHDLLFNNQRALKPDDIQKYAQELGLNMDKFNKDLNSEAIKKQIADDQALAQSLGARGTPTFFINGRKLRGAQPQPRFEALIDEMLKK